MRYLHIAVVEGKGVFPLDMLRRDHCWPKGDADVAVLMHHSTFLPPGWSICVCRHHHTNEPTVAWNMARWQSFGCEIVSAESERV